jgi:diguanylate cyclase (GGDEF)-like protein/PAS domain S-box-containing protein
MQTRPSVSPPDEGLRLASSTIITLVLLYAAFAALWILVYGKVVEWLFTDPVTINLVETFKDLVFIAVTAGLLYGLLRRLLGQARHVGAPAVGLKSMALPLVLISLVVAALTVTGIVQTMVQHRAEEVARLHTIADMKVRRIADWMGERLGDARLLTGVSFYAESYHRWQDMGDTVSRDLMLRQLEAYSAQNSFVGTLLLDEKGLTIWASEGESRDTDLSLRAAAIQALLEEQANYVGPYRDPDGRLYLDFVAPLPAGKAHSGAVVVLRADPRAYLFPLLQDWPTNRPIASVSSEEVLLFRHDGDHILILNDLRHRDDAAGRLRLPVTDPQALVNRPLRGDAGLGSMVEGMDYRGVPSVGFVRAVPGTDWFLAVKLDLAEINAAAARDVLWIAFIGLLTLFATTVGALFFKVAVFDVITDQKNAELVLRESELRHRGVLAALGEGVFGVDREGRCTFVNSAAVSMVGLPESEVLGQDTHTLFHHSDCNGRPYPRAECPVHKTTQDGRIRHVEDWFTRKDGSCFPVELIVTPLEDDGELAGAVVAIQDISERKKIEEKLRHLSYHDMLTGLPNRVLFSDRLKQAIAAAKRDKIHKLSIMYMDLDDFKEINDSLGHAAGDLVLKEVASRIQDCLRESDTAARLGGDEFVVLLPAIEAPDDAMFVAKKICHALCQPIDLGKHGLTVTTSIGIAVYPEHGSEEEALLKHADAAMYHAKESGRNTACLFSAVQQKNDE